MPPAAARGPARPGPARRARGARIPGAWLRLEGEEPQDVLDLFGLDPARHPVAPLFSGDGA